MADRPILFSAPMVRALLDGRKTQTRRALKEDAVRCLVLLGRDVLMASTNRKLLPCAPGDRLWVREEWRAWAEFDKLPPRSIPPGADVQYLADDPLSPWVSRYRHARFMPRWASRLTLTVTDVRVERLRDISEADAWSEGCKPGALNDRGEPFPADEPAPDGKGEIGWDCARDWYADLWDSLHGPDAWDENPWVAAISFDVRRGNIDEVPK